MSSASDFPADQQLATPLESLEPGTRNSLLRHGANAASVTDSGRPASTSLLALDKLGHTISAPPVSVASGSSTMTAPGLLPPFPAQRSSASVGSPSHQIEPEMTQRRSSGPAPSSAYAAEHAPHQRHTAHRLSASPTAHRSSDSDIYDMKTPSSSPPRGSHHESHFYTPSSPGRQDSLPRTPAYPHSEWPVRHVSHSPPPAARNLTHRFGGTMQEDGLHAYMQGMAPFDHKVSPAHRHPTGPYQPEPSRHDQHQHQFVSHNRLYQLAEASSSTAGPSNMMPRTPQPTAGGELARLRAAQQEAETTRLQESERRRPEFFRRNKRPRDIVTALPPESVDDMHRHHPHAGVTIQESPTRGRRLTLYEPSTPSAEDGVPRTPFQQLASPARAWLEADSPTTAKKRRKAESKATQSTTRMRERELEDQVSRRQHRLQAFLREENLQRRSRLQVYDVAGRGRMLVSDEAARRHLRLPGRGVSSPAASSFPISNHNWPVHEYPWVEALPPRQTVQEEEENRLRWLNQFLDRNDDEESSSDEDIDAYRMRHELKQQETARGRPMPESPDARSALYARHDAQEQIFRRASSASVPGPEPSPPLPLGSSAISPPPTRTNTTASTSSRVGGSTAQTPLESDADVINCVCGDNSEDDRAMVGCDGCSFWFHQECVGIRSEDQLGATWYCQDCRPKSRREHRRQRTPDAAVPVLPIQQPQFTIGTPSPAMGRGIHQPLWQGQPTPMTPSRGGTGASASWLAESPSFDSNHLAPSRLSFGTPTARNSATQLFRTPGGGLDFMLDSFGRDLDSSPSRPLAGPGFGGSDLPTFMTPGDARAPQRARQLDDSPLSRLAAQAAAQDSRPRPPSPDSFLAR